MRGLPHASSSNHCQHYFADLRVVAIAMVSQAAVFEVCCLLLLYGTRRVSSQDHQMQRNLTYTRHYTVGTKRGSTDQTPPHLPPAYIPKFPTCHLVILLTGMLVLVTSGIAVVV